MSTLDEFIPCTRAAAEIATFTGQPAPPGIYSSLKSGAYNGQLPVRLANGRLGFSRGDLPKICEALGLTRAAQPEPLAPAAA